MLEAIRRLVRAGAQDGRNGRKADGKIEAQDEAAMTKHGTKDHDPAVKARAEALFRLREEQKREGQSAMDDYMTKQGAATFSRAGAGASVSFLAGENSTFIESAEQFLGQLGDLLALIARSGQFIFCRLTGISSFQAVGGN